MLVDTEWRIILDAPNYFPMNYDIITNKKFLCIRRKTQNTARKVSRYEVFSGPCFPVFGLITEIYEVQEFSLNTAK